MNNFYKKTSQEKIRKINKKHIKDKKKRENKKPTKCPYCNSPVRFEDSKIIYGKSYGMVYICHAFQNAILM